MGSKTASNPPLRPVRPKQDGQTTKHTKHTEALTEVRHGSLTPRRSAEALDREQVRAVGPLTDT